MSNKYFLHQLNAPYFPENWRGIHQIIPPDNPPSPSSSQRKEANYDDPNRNNESLLTIYLLTLTIWQINLYFTSD